MNEVNRSLYILDQKKKCRWNTNTYCVLASNIPTDSKCKMGTTCRTTDGDVCSNGKMMRYLLKNYELDVMTSPKLLIKELAGGKICSCKEDKMTNDDSNVGGESEDDNAIEEDGKLKRMRRSTFSDQADFDKLVAIAGSAASI